MIGVTQKQDWIVFGLGLWLALSPWVLDFTGEPAATANAAMVGVALAVLALLETGISEVAEARLNLAAGLWLVTSPFVLGYGASASAAGNAVVVGVLVMLVSAWAMSLDKEIARWWQEHVAGH